MEEKGIPLDKVCLLDPKAEKELAPEDGDGRFEWFLFGVWCFRPPISCVSDYVESVQGILGSNFWALLGIQYLIMSCR